MPKTYINDLAESIKSEQERVQKILEDDDIKMDKGINFITSSINYKVFFSGCFCDILIRGRIRPERKYYVTKIICFFQERNRFVNCSDPGASFYVLGQTG